MQTMSIFFACSSNLHIYNVVFLILECLLCNNVYVFYFVYRLFTAVFLNGFLCCEAVVSSRTIGIFFVILNLFFFR